ncbi:MAG: hypothetical protein ACYDIE_00635 [Candidatus Krumholzibacteriia bacterium]
MLFTLGFAVPAAEAAPRKDIVTNAGLVGLAITNLGYVGNGFSNPNQPSCEYPLRSHVEHVFLGGIWVGAVAPNGTIHVSTGAQDASSLVAGDEFREFVDSPGAPVNIWSNSQNSDLYDPRALATQHIEVTFDDYANIESGTHTPLGVQVVLRVLAYGNPYADDFVILDYSIINISGGELRDVYTAYWTDTTVGNTTLTTPYDPQAAVKWNYYDDVNGGWGPPRWVPPEHVVANDPGIWMMYERDDDGDQGLATSWVGTRLLGASPHTAAHLSAEGDTLPPVSYNSWRFQGVPAQDDVYVIDAGLPTEQQRAGKYQVMSNGEFDAGVTAGGDFTVPSDWMGLLSTGPWPYMAPGDTIHVTYAIVCGADSLSLLANSKVAQVAYDAGFSIPAGPPSPRLAVATDNDRIILSWSPGDSAAADVAGQSPEYHLSSITNKPDFQGYRIYRFQGETITEDPYHLATLVAQYDKIDGIGFDTGLPPLDQDGRRRFVDEHLLDGFPYWYSVVSFSAPNLEAGLPEFQSGFNENAQLVYPGSAPSTPTDRRKVGVFPNPYRAGSLYDSPRGELELGRKIWFTGLPTRSRIQVFNLAGDLIKTLQHDDPDSGQESWNLLTEPVRALATGLYVYVVTDLDSGEIQRGKLVIIK